MSFLIGLLGVLLVIWGTFFVLGITMFAWDFGIFIIYGWVGVLLVIYLVMAIKKISTTDDKKRRKEREEFERREKRRPVAAVLVCTREEAKASLGWAALGYFGMGPIGAALGAGVGKPRTTVVFSVRYADGHTGTEKVEVNTRRFNELSALLLK